MYDKGLYFEWPKNNILCDTQDMWTLCQEFDILVLNDVKIQGERVPLGNVCKEDFWSWLPDFDIPSSRLTVSAANFQHTWFHPKVDTSGFLGWFEILVTHLGSKFRLTNGGVIDHKGV